MLAVQIFRVALLVAAFTGANYLAWRVSHSLHTTALWFSLPLLWAETMAYLGVLLFGFALWRPKRRSSAQAREGLLVDIWITTYNEPVSCIETTLRAALGVRYPHRVYLLDDGARPELERMATGLGCGYLARGTNRGGKAGNLNHAFRHTSADFILVLDADFVPSPDALDQMLGYFANPEVAFVQGPQRFHNIPKGDPFGNGAGFFYGPIQMGKDGWDAAFSCGTLCVFRRAALEELARSEGWQDEGPFPTGSLTEDFHTSLRLHSLGWKSVYHPKSCGFGLAPANLPDVVGQRLRWATGTIQVALQERPITRPGLSLAQRLCYLGSCYFYLSCFWVPVLLVSPVVFLFTGHSPMHTDLPGFLQRFPPYYMSVLLALAVASYGRGGWRGMQDSVAYFPLFLYAFFQACTGRRLNFKVTPKDGRRAGGFPAVLLPTLCLFGLSLVAVAFGLFLVASDRSATAVVPTLMNVGWAGVNLALLSAPLRAALWRGEDPSARLLDQPDRATEVSVGVSGVD